MNRLLVIENNLEFSRNLLNYIAKQNKKMELWSLSIDGNKVFKHLEDLQEEDIVILDLGIPNLSGLKVIQKIIQSTDKNPYIIVIAGNTQNMNLIDKYKNYIYSIIERPHILKRIVATIEEIFSYLNKDNYEQLVRKELKKFEVNPITIGYRYILESIVYALEDEELTKNMRDGLYKKVSQNHNNVTEYNIKWTIEKSVESIRRYTSEELMSTYFNLKRREKLSPKLFITTIVYNLKKYKNKEIETDKKELITLR